MNNEQNIHLLVEHSITLSKNLEKQGVLLNEQCIKIDKIFESVAGNEELGHKGIAHRLKELEGHHLTFREQYEKEKSQRAKTWGFMAGIMAFVTLFGKAFLVKISLLFT